MLETLINGSLLLAILSTLVPKPGKPADLGTSYRPISLLCPTVKVLERLLQPKLAYFLSYPDNMASVPITPPSCAQFLSNLFSSNLLSSNFFRPILSG